MNKKKSADELVREFAGNLYGDHLHITADERQALQDAGYNPDTCILLERSEDGRRVFTQVRISNPVVLIFK